MKNKKVLILKTFVMILFFSLIIKVQPLQAATTTKSSFTGNTYKHNSRYSGYTIYNGIDVSKYQASINWTKVKKAGIDYAFIRCGYSGTSAGTLNRDSYFETNIKNAYNAGVKIGIYYFSQARNTAEALAEANYTLSLINQYKSYITLPVVYDFEAQSSSYRAYGLSKTRVTNNTIVFCNTIKNAGYKVMYYGNPSELASSFDSTKLTSYPCWLAQYPSLVKTSKTLKSSYTGNYLFWQYSSAGSVSGISGNVDMNFYYASSPTQNYIITGVDSGAYAGTNDTVATPAIDYSNGTVSSFKMSARDSGGITLSWSHNTTADGYQIWRSTSQNGTYTRLKTITSASTITWEDTTASENSEYYYKIRAYKTVNNTKYYSAYSTLSVSATTSSAAKPSAVTGFKQLRNTATTITLSWKKNTSATGYEIYRSTARNGKYSKVKTITKNTTTSWTNKARAKNRIYYYKIRAYSTADGSKTYSSFSTVKLGHTNKYSGKYKRTKASLNVRTYAGTAYKKITTLSKNKRVKLLYATKDKSGVTWYKISWSGKTGYVSGRYLK